MELQEYKSAVHAYVTAHRGEMISLLRRLIQIRSLSVSVRQEECQDLLAAEMEQMGLAVDRWVPDWESVRRTVNPRTGDSVYQPIEDTNPEYLQTRERVSTLVGAYDTGRTGRTMLFNGHIDVVSPEPLSDWTVDPWGGEVRGGRIYGRGSSDQKGGVVAMLYALKAVVETGAELSGRVLISVTPDEENGGNGAAAMVARGYRADGGVITDLSGNDIHISCIGMQRFQVDLFGKSGFMGRADEAVNAVDLMCQAVQNLREFEQSRNEYARERFGFSREVTAATVNTGRIEAGEWHATIPGKASISGLMGVLADDDVRTFRRDFERQLTRGRYEAWYAEHPPRVTYFGTKEGCITAPDAPIVLAMEQAASVVRGRPVRGRHGEVATDMNYFVSTGTPCVHFGPGKMGHCADEALELDELWEATEIMALSMIAFLGQRGAAPENNEQEE